MRMRIGVLWSAVALALLAVSSALRTPQVEGVSRTSRRLTAPSAPNKNSFSTDSPDSASTYRSRSNRRREETPRDVIRTKTRNMPETTEQAEEPERPSGNNERFDSRRTRTRRPIETPRADTDETLKNARSRSRSTARRPTTLTPEVSSPSFIDKKIEFSNTNVDDISKIATKQDNMATTQLRRRNSISQTTETVALRRGRGRSNIRPSARALDLDSSGSTNSILIIDKAPTTARTSADLRNARKLRYKTRPSATESNLTGEGIIALNEVKSSQIENITSQHEIQTATPVPVARVVQQSTEANKPKSTTLKVTRVVRRPLGRGKATHTPFVAAPNKKSDDISEDDNYPESFKALIQAKNATQASSPMKESLSVKASQKIFKTYSTSTQSTQTGPAENKYSRLQKQRIEESNKPANEEETIATTTTPEVTSQHSEYKLRGKYSARNKKSTSFSPTATTASSVSQNTEKIGSKYSRKFKFTTTTKAPRSENNNKRIENSDLRKPALRPSFYSRKLGKNTFTSTEVSVSVSEKKEEISVRKKVSLPRTSYYTRLRNKTETTTTTEAAIKEISDGAQQKKEDMADMPLIFTLFNKSENKELVSDSLKKVETENSSEPFIISVSSTESQDKTFVSFANEGTSNMAEESEGTFSVSPTVATKKDTDKQIYHANFKNTNRNLMDNTRASSTVPPVRNLQRRRQRTGQKDKIEDSPDTTTARSRDKNVRKFSEAFSKTTEASNNGIIAETEKVKSRFSSKYRASYLNKPFYKPTVPTITSSTAWLKFFVTDHLLTQSVEEPNWFEEHVDETTESFANATSPYIHPSSIELVEGEEMQLGPDNAISITQTRRTLSSADLRLSESLLKSSQVMNVEASHYSPSVTVSIFDALAEILTSTPKTRLSSTTEVTTKPNLNTDVTQILDGVSSIVYVNSAGSITSPDLFVPASARSTTTQSVQNTVHTTPNVINNMSPGESVTPSLNAEVETPANTPQTPIPTPTTPVSARRPFAIKVLYSDTESSTDKPSTEADLTSNQLTTDNPTMVYNTVSDLLLSSNNLVSSELTSMLSNNIRSIIQNMDEDSRSRISVDMAKLLKSLIPRAIDGLPTALDNADFIPNTTPYSLEDIKDTENIDVFTNLDSFDILQSITTDNSVNGAGANSNPVTSSVVVTDNPAQSVNNIDVTQGVTQGPIFESSSQTTLIDLSVTAKAESRAAFEILPITTSSSVSSSSEAVTSSGLLGIQTDTVNNNNSTSTNNTAPLPFLTNFQLNDFTPSDLEVINLTKSLPLNQNIVGPPRGSFDINLQDPSQVSPLQLWVLSKKASVLKMIEDLLRQHNTELATAPTFAEIISPSNNDINLSERLTNIMNTMTFTTESTETTKSDLNSTTTSILSPVPLSTTVQTLQTDSTSSGISDDGSLTFNTPGLLASQDGLQQITTPSSGLSLRFGFDTENGNTDSTLTTESTSRNTLLTTTEQMQSQDSTADSFTTGSIATTTAVQENTETTTASANIETTTQTNTETTTEVNGDITTQTDTETTTDVITNQNTTSAVPLSAATPTIPKKDYVIFGILPNNTVVRKDPNDDALESLTEASPYIVYGLLPNNTVIRKFPNGTRVPRIIQKIDILPISPWSLRNPYSPIHNIPAIVRPQFNPTRVSTNTVTSADITNNGTDTVNNQETMISSSALNIKSSSLGITIVTNKPPAEISTASHVLSLRTTTMLPSIDEILLNSISSAAKQEMVISSMTSSTREPTILTLDIDPETKQIRTERPGDGDGNTVFKFIPIDEVMVKQQNSNVLKLATKAPSTLNTDKAEVQIETVTMVTETNTQASQTQAYTDSASTTAPETTILTNTPVFTTESTTVPQITEATTVVLTTTQAPTTNFEQTTSQATTTQVPTTKQAPITTQATTTQVPTTTQAPTTTEASTMQTITITQMPTTTTITQAVQTTIQAIKFEDEIKMKQPSQNVQNTARDPKYLNVQSFNNLLTGAESGTTTRIAPTTAKQNDPTALLQALLSATGNKNTGTLSIPNLGTNIREQTTTSRSIEDDIRQFEEDTKLLKALLAATGQNPANLNIPSLDALITTTRAPTTEPPTTTTRPTTTQATTTRKTITTQATTPSLQNDLKQIQEDTKLLQALLLATGQNTGNLNIPDISRVTSNVRIASNPLTTQIGSNPTTPLNAQPVFATTNGPVFRTFAPRTVSTTPEVSTTEDVRISTTFTPFTQSRPTTVRNVETGTLSGRQAPSRFTVTTETPSTSTFSVQEDLAFLQNLKSVLNTNAGDEDPETALANRIISLAVDRSLTEIQTGNSDSGVRTGKTIANSANDLIPTPTTTTTTTTTTTSTPRTTTTKSTTTQQEITKTNAPGGPSIDDDIKQFQEDTKLLQALLKATGQDPSKFNIPTLPIITSTTVSPISDGILFTLPASPSSHKDATPKPSMMSTVLTDKTLPFGAKLAVKDELRTVQDDRKLLTTLIKLQDAQETTTFRSKLAITGQTSDEALKKLIQQQKATGMVSEATKSPISLSTEYGKSNDALLAALLKEQGFGPTTASSIDEQLRLAALLNQVVVTPKARRTTTPPPPPAPRRPILDGLAWLWQQWRETGPGPSPSQRPGPAPSVRPSEATSNRVNWFGSGPFTGNADDRPATSNRIPLEPPRAVTSEQTPGRGQLVSAAINVTRAFSQFLGAAIQGAAQTVQSVFRAGQRAAGDVYSNGSGGSG